MLINAKYACKYEVMQSCLYLFTSSQKNHEL